MKWVLLSTRALLFAACISAAAVFSSPPVAAQQSVQQAEIAELQRRADVSDALAQSNRAAIANLKGEAQIFSWVLSLLSGGTLGLQLLNNRKGK